jgi:hypothetical protein
VLRKHGTNPNALMEALHLKQFADEGERQTASAAQGTAAAAAAAAEERAAFRGSLKWRMAAARADKAARLQHDEAVHAAILRHQVGWAGPLAAGPCAPCSVMHRGQQGAHVLLPAMAATAG